MNINYSNSMEKLRNDSSIAEIQNLNIEDLNIEELEKRIEMAAGDPYCLGRFEIPDGCPTNVICGLRTNQ